MAEGQPWSRQCHTSKFLWGTVADYERALLLCFLGVGKQRIALYFCKCTVISYFVFFSYWCSSYCALPYYNDIKIHHTQSIYAQIRWKALVLLLAQLMTTLAFPSSRFARSHAIAAKLRLSWNLADPQHTIGFTKVESNRYGEIFPTIGIKLSSDV